MSFYRASAWAATIGLLAYGAACLVLRAQFDLFDSDELQHAHLAWQVATGKVLYRDIWDNHGPLYTYLNAALLRLTDAPASIDLLFWCRGIGAATMAGLGGMTYLLGRRLGFQPLVALAAVAVTSLLLIVQDKGAECRPDSLQNLFWLAGLVLVAGNSGRFARLAAGLLWGMAVMANTKAALGPALVCLFWLLAVRLHGRPLSSVASDVCLVAFGGLLAWLPFAAHFYRQGALFALHDYSLLWNLLYVASPDQPPLAQLNIGFLLREQTGFVVLAVAGAACWVADLTRSDGSLPKFAGWTVLAAAVGTGATVAMDFYYQFFLIFLPLWSLAAAFALERLAAAAQARMRGLGALLTAAVALAAVASLVTTSGRLTPRAERSELAFQKSFTKMLLRTTPRSEPLGVIWDICGGFMFNEPVQFYWGAEAAIGVTAERHGGADPFGAPFIDALERGQVRFVVGRDDRALRDLPAATAVYLREHYRYSYCLWTRKMPARAGGA